MVSSLGVVVFFFKSLTFNAKIHEHVKLNIALAMTAALLKKRQFKK